MENCVKTMTLGEVARFVIPPYTFKNYDALERTLRDIRNQKKTGKISHSGCSHGLNETPDNTDLDTIHDHTILFTVSLENVEKVGQFNRELWETSHFDKFQNAISSKKQGNKLYQNEKYGDASEVYKLGIMALESIVLSAYMIDAERELIDNSYKTATFNVYKGKNVQPGELYEVLQALRLNYAACKLKMGEYLPVIQQCTEVLVKDSENVKALFRRAQAYGKLGRDLELARRDIESVRNIVQGKIGMKDLEAELVREEGMLNNSEKAFLETEKSMFAKMFV